MLPACRLRDSIAREWGVLEYRPWFVGHVLSRTPDPEGRAAAPWQLGFPFLCASLGIRESTGHCTGERDLHFFGQIEQSWSCKSGTINQLCYNGKVLEST